MRRYVPVVLALTFVVAAGVAHGVWTGRWGGRESLDEPLARLARVPASFGDWEGQDQALDERQRVRAGIEGYVLRRYRNRHTGAQVMVLLVCGRVGPIAVHTPDVCYEGAGYTRTGDVEGHAAGDAAFQVATFREENVPVPSRLRVYWSWSDGGAWRAPRFPRWAFARSPALFKLYVVRRTLRADDADPVPGFLPDLLAQLSEPRPSGSGRVPAP